MTPELQEHISKKTAAKIKAWTEKKKTKKARIDKANKDNRCTTFPSQRQSANRLPLTSNIFEKAISVPIALTESWSLLTGSITAVMNDDR